MREKKYCLWVIMSLMLCLVGLCTASASTLTIPSGVKTIEEEAFYGDTSLGEVILPEGLEEIGPRAFAESGLTKINLPSSLKKENISESAFNQGVQIEAQEGTEAYEWAEENGFIISQNAQKAPEIFDVNFTCKRIHYTEDDGKIIRDVCDYSYGVIYNCSMEFDFINPISMSADFCVSVSAENYINTQYFPEYLPSDPLKIVRKKGCEVSDPVYKSSTAGDIYYRENYSLSISCSTKYGETTVEITAVPEDVYISKYVTLKGRCVLESGEPVKNVEVRSAFDDSLITYTDDQGYWTFEKFSRDCEGQIVKFNHPDYYFITNNNLSASYTESVDLGEIIGTSKNIEATSEITGIITTADGTPIPEVFIHAVNTSDQMDQYTAISRDDGTWSLRVKKNETYKITYTHFTYDIPEEITTVSDNASLSAIAALSGEIDQNSYFTMAHKGNAVGDEVSVMVGSEVQFTVFVPGASKVQLVVDDIEYEEYRVTDGEASFSRTFSQAGTRVVRFRIMKDGEYMYSSYTPAHTLIIDKNDTLKIPVVHAPAEYDLSSEAPFEISWHMEDHDHTAGYRVYLYYDGVRIYPSNMESVLTQTTGLRLEIPKYVLFAGDKWTAEVVAAGKEGWSSSTGSSEMFSIVEGHFSMKLPAKSSSFGIGDKIELQIKTDFNLDECTYTISSSDPDNTVIKDNEVRFKKAGQYELTGSLKHGSETYSAPTPVTVNIDEAAVELVAVEVIEQPENREKVYPSYCWEPVGTKISYRLKTTFTPESIITVKEFSKETVNDHEYLLSAVFDEANTKVEPAFVFTYLGGSRCSPPDTIPVYVMADNPNEGNTHEALRDTVIYSTPDGNRIEDLLKNETVIVGGIYGSYVEVFFRRGNGGNVTNGFVLAEDLRPAGDSALPETSLSIIPALESNDINIVQFVQGESKRVELTIQAEEGIDRIDAYVDFIPAEAYRKDRPYQYRELGQAEECIRVGSSSQFKYTLTVNQLGSYYLKFHPYNMRDHIDFKRVSVEQPVTAIYETVGEYYRYAFCKAFSGGKHDLEKTPFTSEWEEEEKICKVGWDTSLKILGYAGNDISCVEATMNGNNYHGFISLGDLVEEPNEIIKRGYVLVSEDHYGDIDHLHDEEYKNNTFYVALNSGLRAKKMFLLAGIENRNIVPDYDTTNAELDTYLARIVAEQDDNDLTYLYLTAHGSTDGIQMDNYLRDHEIHGFYNVCWLVGTIMGDYSGYSQKTIASNLSNIKGGLVFLYDSCHSGALLQHVSGFDKKKYAIIPSTSADLDAWGSDNYWCFTEEAAAVVEHMDEEAISLGGFFSDILHGLSVYVKSEEHTRDEQFDQSGLIRIVDDDEDPNKIYAIFPLVPKYQIPQKYGDDGNIIFWR